MPADRALAICDGNVRPLPVVCFTFPSRIASAGAAARRRDAFSSVSFYEAAPEIKSVPFFPFVV